MKTRSPGFTLLELMVTVAIIGIVAAAAIPAMRAATRNAGVGSTAFDLQLRLTGLRTRALADQVTILAVLVDAPGNRGNNCVLGRASECATLFVLREPSPAWTLATFLPDTPAANASFDDSHTLGKGIRFANDATMDATRIGHAGPPPFEAVKVFDPVQTGTCDGRACVAIRYSANGAVSAELVGNPPVVPKGLAFALGSDLIWETATAESRGVMISFPTGIVKGFPL